jgi:hypothetical protein
MKIVRLTQSKNSEGPRNQTGQSAPGGHIRAVVPPKPDPDYDESPDQDPTGPRSPYPVDEPGINDPKGPGSEPDYLPGGPTNPNTRY